MINILLNLILVFLLCFSDLLKLRALPLNRNFDFVQGLWSHSVKTTNLYVVMSRYTSKKQGSHKCLTKIKDFNRSYNFVK